MRRESDRHPPIPTEVRTAYDGLVALGFTQHLTAEAWRPQMLPKPAQIPSVA